MRLQLEPESPSTDRGPFLLSIRSAIPTRGTRSGTLFPLSQECCRWVHNKSFLSGLFLLHLILPAFFLVAELCVVVVFCEKKK